MRPKRLSVPEVLAVAVLLSCTDDGGDEGTSASGSSSGEDTDSASTTATTSSPTTSATMTATATTEATTDATTGTADSGTTGPIEVPDCSMYPFVAECNDDPLCVWQMDMGGCVVDCMALPDITTCTENACFWTGDACEFPPIA